MFLGMNHRTKPYDFKNSNDIIEATVMVTAKYLDMTHYWIALNDVEEAFDESLEYFNPAAWINIGLKGTTNRKDFDKAIKSLRSTSDIFRELMDTTEEKCAEMWQIVFFSSPEAVKKHFFTEIDDYNQEKVNQALEIIFENIFKIEYDGNIENSAYNFAKTLKEILKVI